QIAAMKIIRQAMHRSELRELHYITPIANVPSILCMGILSYNQAKREKHQSVAMDDIQDRRARVVVPRGRKLHEYVNLYICARNPMMYKRRGQYRDLVFSESVPT
ncbi:MAG: DarT ssDNA thymidine ADP-ribosyltransferase family protein, partial [Desulfomonilaceae bacterium]